MRRFAFGVAALALLLSARPALATCRRLGTQLECDLGASVVEIGTQANPSALNRWPAFAPGAFGARGESGFGADSRPASRFRFQLQSFGSDTTTCRKLGNETYCY